MSEPLDGTPVATRQRAHRKKARRVALAALGTAALVLGSATAASATAAPVADPAGLEVPSFEAPSPESPSPEAASLDEALDLIEAHLPQPALPGTQPELPDTAGLGNFISPTTLTAEGMPQQAESGTPISLSFAVENQLLGAPVASGEVVLLEITDTSIVDGPVLLGTQELVDGRADMVIRPFGTGERTLVALYTGSAKHLLSYTFFEPLTVTPVETVLTVEIDSGSAAYGGGTLGVWVTAESMCESQTRDAAVQELCESTHGAPAGEVTLKMNDEVVGTQAVVGTERVGVPTWLDLDTSFSTPDAQSVFRFDVPIPDRAFGSPENYAFTAEFTPTNWFTAAVAEAPPVEALAAATSTHLLLGDMERPVTSVRVGEAVDLMAYVAVEPHWAAPASGVVNLKLNGETLVEGLTFKDGEPASYLDLTFEEAGTHELVAEFVPDTLNHTGSVSTAYELTVTKPAPDGGKPTPDGGKRDGDSGAQITPVVKQDDLARSGSDSRGLALGAGALLTVAVGTALVLARRRTAHAE